jgi:hypothetical protein
VGSWESDWIRGLRQAPFKTTPEGDSRKEVSPSAGRGTFRQTKAGFSCSPHSWGKIATMAGPSPDPGNLVSVVIKRRNIVQYVVRSYAVVIDGLVVGKIWAFQTKGFTVAPERHELQLEIVNTGRSCSDVFKIDVNPGNRLVFRTHARGLKNTLMLPFALPAGAKALARDEQLQSKYYEWPWIRLKLED